MTREEIIQALRCCSKRGCCCGCPVAKSGISNCYEMHGKAADLLEAQEREEKNDPCLPEDLMPYDDLSITAAIQDATANLLDQWEKAGDNCSPIGILNVNREWTRTISKALAVYKAVLLNGHGEPKENVI